MKPEGETVMAMASKTQTIIYEWMLHKPIKKKPKPVVCDPPDKTVGVAAVLLGAAVLVKDNPIVSRRFWLFSR